MAEPNGNDAPDNPTDALPAGDPPPANAPNPPPSDPATPPVPAGVDPDEWNNDVDFTPKQQKRFDRVYGQMKSNERLVNQLVEDNQNLVQKVDELMSSQTQARAEDKIAALEQDLERAAEDGDVARVKTLTNEIAETRVLASTQAPASEPAGQPSTPSEPPPAQSGGLQLTQAEAQAVQTWAFERDTGGEYLRPWSHPGHPRHDEFLAIATDAARGAANVEEGLAEVDRRMTSRAAPQVLNSDPSLRPPGSRAPELSNEQRTIAMNMFGPGTKMNLSEADAVKRYQDSVQKHGTRRQ